MGIIATGLMIGGGYMVMSYLAMRIWTYLVYAEIRLDISQQPLSEADVEWFKQTLATDFRIVLNLVTNVSFLLAAFVPVHSFKTLEERGFFPLCSEDRWVLLRTGDRNQWLSLRGSLAMLAWAVSRAWDRLVAIHLSAVAKSAFRQF